MRLEENTLFLRTATHGAVPSLNYRPCMVELCFMLQILRNTGMWWSYSANRKYSRKKHWLNTAHVSCSVTTWTKNCSKKAELAQIIYLCNMYHKFKNSIKTISFQWWSMAKFKCWKKNLSVSTEPCSITFSLMCAITTVIYYTIT